MEFFLMSTIEKAGLNSMYRLQQMAGLQPGGIRPTLARLERYGLLARERGSKHGRKELKLSEQGRQVLEEHWDAAIDRSYLDIESVLRAACCALLMNEAERACIYLNGQAEVRSRWANEREREAARFADSEKDPIGIYAWLKNECDAARKKAESKTLFAISDQLRTSFGITYSDLEHDQDPRQKGGHMPQLR